MKTNKILVGVDFGPATDSVIAYSSFFAATMDASLHLLYVVDYLVTPPAYLAPYFEEEKKAAEEKFLPLKEKLRCSDIKVRTEVIMGRLHESFDLAMQRTKSDMIILGFRRHALRRSSSEKLIKSLRIPMLVVRGEKAEAAYKSTNIRRILCPVDFSDISGRALEAAKELADQFSCKLHVLHVIHGEMITKMIAKSGKGQEILKQLLEEFRLTMLNFLNKFGIIGEGVIEEGEPDKVIVSYARKEDVDLIVIGARGIGRIKEMLIGSTTDAVLKTSACPVFVIH
ncbi:MAG: universal stress protein [Nitrospirota bacterium]